MGFYRSFKSDRSESVIAVKSLLGYRLFDILQPVEYTGCHVNHLGVHLAITGDGVRNWNRNNLVPAERGHLSEFAAVEHIDCTQSITGCQHAVKCAGRPAPLDVSEHDGSRFIARALFKLLRQ